MCAFAGAGIIGSRLCRRVCSCHTKLIQPVQPQTLPFICIMHDIKTRLKPSILIYYSPECRSFFLFSLINVFASWCCWCPVGGIQGRFTMQFLMSLLCMWVCWSAEIYSEQCVLVASAHKPAWYANIKWFITNAKYFFFRTAKLSPRVFYSKIFKSLNSLVEGREQEKKKLNFRIKPPLIYNPQFFSFFFFVLLSILYQKAFERWASPEMNNTLCCK